MVNKLGKILTNALVNHAQVDESERVLYEYGFFILISNAIYTTFTLLVGFILKQFFESVIYYITFSLLRRYAGGFHATSERSCRIITILSIVLSLIIIKACDTHNLKKVIIPLTVVAIFLIFAFCPMDTAAKQLNMKEKIHYRRISRTILSVIVFVIIISFCCKIIILIYPCCVGLILEGALLIFGKIKEIKKRMDNNTFGMFLKDKRKQNGLSLRAMAKQVGLSHVYLYNIECGKKAPPNDDAVKELANAVNLEEKSRLLFFDIAARCKSDADGSNYYIPIDISQYLNENEDVINVIREVNRNKQHNEFWRDLLKELKK